MICAGRSQLQLSEESGKRIDPKKAKQTFREMAARTPEVGSLLENPLRICLSSGMVWLSIYEAADGTLEEACFGEMVTTSMASPLVMAAFKAKSRTAFTIEGQKKRADAAARLNPLAKDNPFQWNTEVILGRDTDEYTINYYQCGLCALGRQEALFHLVPYMCVLDIMSVDWMGGVLHRTKTLATGGDCCNFYICKKASKWDAQKG